MGVRPNGLGASQSAWTSERDEATAARHRGFLDVHEDEPHSRNASRRPRRETVHVAPPVDEVLPPLLDRTVGVEAEADDMEPMTKWPLVIGTLLAAIAILVMLGAIGALPFR